MVQKCDFPNTKGFRNVTLQKIECSRNVTFVIRNYSETWRFKKWNVLEMWCSRHEIFQKRDFPETLFPGHICAQTLQRVNSQSRETNEKKTIPKSDPVHVIRRSMISNYHRTSHFKCTRFLHIHPNRRPISLAHFCFQHSPIKWFFGGKVWSLFLFWGIFSYLHSIFGVCLPSWNKNFLGPIFRWTNHFQNDVVK